MESDSKVPGSLVLGIDTGGTYTDGVLMEYETRRVLATHKSLTTKRDFSIGIEKVIEGIHIEDPSAIKMVSISTTLATNAIAEGKGKRVALFLIGYDPELLANFRMEQRFATPQFYYFQGGHDLYGREKAELDLPGILALVNRIKNDVDAIAVSSYFSPLNPEHENRAYNAIGRICDLPVVLGHQLSTKLGSVERATTAALNASLLAVLQDFVIAVRRAMERRRIIAPLMVVRGDGTLMSDEFAARTPVETIHSGPAASAIGGRFLSGLDEALVVDVGGTTTDLALILNGQVTVSVEGAMVGEYKTCVQAANLLSIALGGDSHISYLHDGQIAVGPERVQPLSHLAADYPDVDKRLKALARRQWAQATPDWLEYWYLLREPPASLLQSPRVELLVDLLRDGPQPVPDIVKRLKVLHIGQVDAQELLRQEIIGRAGLTPTDLMHIEGTYARWDAGAAAAAMDVFAHNRWCEPGEVRQQVWHRITEMALHAIVTFLSGKRLAAPGDPDTNNQHEMGPWFFSNSLYHSHPHLDCSFQLRHPIIGIGAPAALFLKPVAEALHTELILPNHYEVANAVGAIAGTVMVTEEILVYPRLDHAGMEVLGYYTQAGDTRSEFEDLGPALNHARTLSRERALGGALRSGADNPQLVVEELSDGLDTYRVRAKAMGKPRLARRSAQHKRGLEMEMQRVDTRRAYELIWARITTLELAPGSQINEQSLAHDLNMALTPVQEALKVLEHEHLVRIDPRHGTYVADIDLPDLGQISELRLAVESLAAGLAAQRATDDDLAVLDAIRQEQVSADPGDARRLFDIDHKFHQAIAQAAHNRYLEQTLDHFFGLSLRLWYLLLPHLEFLPGAVEKHLELVDAIRARERQDRREHHVRPRGWVLS